MSGHQHQQHQQLPPPAAGSGMSSGKRFLADLADALPQPQQTGGSRPILGVGGGGGGGGANCDLPDSAAHSWNVNVADFVPQAASQQQQQQQQPLPRLQQQQQQPAIASSQSADVIVQLVGQTLAALASPAAAAAADSSSSRDRDRADAELNESLLQLYQLARTRADLDRLVQSALAVTRHGGRQLCEPAANLLAFLAVNFVVSEQVSPQLLGDRTSRLAGNPVYESLLTVCSAENERVRLELASKGSVTPDQASYILVFAWLYIYLPSLQTPTQRQAALAREAIVFLRQLVDLPASAGCCCPLAFDVVRTALAAIGAPLDFDCCGEPDFAGDPAASADLAKMLADLYDQLRAAVASGRVGDPLMSVDLIRLLELRASGWPLGDDPEAAASAGPPFPFGSAGASSGGGRQSGFASRSAAGGGDVPSMTDDMFADYEQFLRDSGQL